MVRDSGKKKKSLKPDDETVIKEEDEEQEEEEEQEPSVKEEEIELFELEEEGEPSEGEQSGSEEALVAEGAMPCVIEFEPLHEVVPLRPQPVKKPQPKKVVDEYLNVVFELDPALVEKQKKLDEVLARKVALAQKHGVPIELVQEDLDPLRFLMTGRRSTLPKVVPSSMREFEKRLKRQLELDKHRKLQLPRSLKKNTVRILAGYYKEYDGG